MNEKLMLISKIEQGVVIDHIPAGLGAEILQIARFHAELADIPITFGMNLQSRKLGKKDIIKIQMDEPPKGFFRHLSLIAPGVTIKSIRNFKVQKKIVVEPPEVIDNLLKCLNPGCITNHERHLGTCFHRIEGNPPIFVCNYCERHFELRDLEPIQQKLLVKI
ncbi:MAG: aspartate carbamoyltransferase regulatory subunit [Candidatus Ozemobacteraceae bacterium]